jgi:hypothetical protein
MEKRQLVERLEQVINNNFQGELEDNSELSYEMIRHIGSTDPYLRDELIYTVFLRWILNNQLAGEDTAKIIKQLLDDEHLFYKLGVKDDDSVYCRSFSVLICAALLYGKRKYDYENFVSIPYAFDRIMNYFVKEQDWRGYTQEAGWAHAIAHTADTIDELVQFDEIGHEALSKVLYTIKDKLASSQQLLWHEEDERLVTAVMSALNRQLIPVDEVRQWIKSFSEIDKNEDFMLAYAARVNCKQFLRSLYFRMNASEAWSNLCHEINEVLRKDSKFY